MTIILKNGNKIYKEKKDYEGFFTHPISWDRVVRKFERLSELYVDITLQKEIIEAIANLEYINTVDLTSLLGNIINSKGE
jgi:2-methylcitrate dehydratase